MQVLTELNKPTITFDVLNRIRHEFDQDFFAEFFVKMGHEVDTGFMTCSTFFFFFKFVLLLLY